MIHERELIDIYIERYGIMRDVYKATHRDARLDAIKGMREFLEANKVPTQISKRLMATAERKAKEEIVD
jgi:hypothetical protein